MDRAGPWAVVVAVADKIMNSAINCSTLTIFILQTFMDSAHNDAGELVFYNFSLLAKSISCFKMFITAYHTVPTKGSETFAFVCLLGFFLHSYAITTHLNMNCRAWARTWIVGMATLMGAGVFLLCRGMFIPKDQAWHTVAVLAILIFVVFLETALLIHTQINEDAGNQNLLRDLLMKFVETQISIYRCVDSIRQTRTLWKTEKTLQLVGSGLPILVGACQVGWIAYKAGVMRKVVEWMRKLPRVFAGEEEMPAGAIEGDGGGDAAKKVATEEIVEVVVAVPA